MAQICNADLIVSECPGIGPESLKLDLCNSSIVKLEFYMLYSVMYFDMKLSSCTC